MLNILQKLSGTSLTGKQGGELEELAPVESEEEKKKYTSKTSFLIFKKEIY